jgi:acyl-CoA thioesterase II
MAGDFARDTAVAGADGAYRAHLSGDWEGWGPLGGYVAAIALRAVATESRLPRPASFQCLFLSVATFADVELEVETLRRSKRAEAFAVRMTQAGTPILHATACVVDDGLDGFVHTDAVAPDVAGPERLRPFDELVEHYDESYPVWRTFEGRPTLWPDAPSPPVWRTWMRLRATPDLTDPFLDAARTLMWMDMMMWNAAPPPHLPWPVAYLAPNLDLACLFHERAPDDEWLLCDAHAPSARGGLVGCTGRVWTPSGRLVASGASQLLCRPNPMAAAAS